MCFQRIRVSLAICSIRHFMERLQELASILVEIFNGFLSQQVDYVPAKRERVFQSIFNSATFFSRI